MSEGFTAARPAGVPFKNEVEMNPEPGGLTEVPVADNPNSVPPRVAVLRTCAAELANLTPMQRRWALQILEAVYG